MSTDLLKQNNELQLHVVEFGGKVEGSACKTMLAVAAGDLRKNQFVLEWPELSLTLEQAKKLAPVLMRWVSQNSQQEPKPEPFIGLSVKAHHDKMVQEFVRSNACQPQQARYS